MEESTDRPDAGRRLCGLKTRGFVEIIERLLDKEALQPNAEARRIYAGKPYRVEKWQEHLKVWFQGRLVLEMVGMNCAPATSLPGSAGDRPHRSQAQTGAVNGADGEITGRRRDLWPVAAVDCYC